MIRVALPDGWLLIAHPDHARLAGEFARHWGNDDFAPPQPRDDILVAVSRHDDAWTERDAAPLLTREGRPSAFSHELVGTYTAFEEIDLEDYLRVRGRAAEAVAADNPFAAIIVSMHTMNLLTENADTSSFTPAQRDLHARFLEAQRARQAGLAGQVRAAPSRERDVEPATLQRAFEFLQGCDSLSLLACVDYPQPRAIRHRHPRRDGRLEGITCTPLGARTFRVEPWPFAPADLQCVVPAKRIAGTVFPDVESFRAAYRAGEPTPLRVTLVP